MRTSSTTVRSEPRLKKAFARLAQSLEISVSDLINMLMRAAVNGKIHVGFMQTHVDDVCPLCGPDPAAKYPPGYLAELDKEVMEMERLHAEGKLKTYASAKELFDEILGR